MTEALLKTSDSLAGSFDEISSERRRLLDELAIYINGKLISQKQVKLVFICTHNSRRSIMAQIWAKAAAVYYKIPNVDTFSGGTKKTAFNSHAVKALKKAGFKIKPVGEGSNPRYRVKISKGLGPLTCFSKKFSHKSNPDKDFVAIVTCSEADQSCPVIAGAEYRTSIRYQDPKDSDGTKLAGETYMQRSLQIGREMLYVFHKVSKL